MWLVHLPSLAVYHSCKGPLLSMMYSKIKKFFHIGRNYPTNFAINHTVDQNVQSMLLPLNLMQYMMLCPKYCIKNNVISPNSLISNFVSIVSTLAFISLYVYRNYMLFFCNDYLEYTTYMYISSYFDLIFHSFGFIINCTIGIIHMNESITFVLTLQKVHRFLNNETCTRCFIIWNWISVILALFICVVVSTSFATYMSLSFYYIFVTWLLTFFDFNIVYIVRVYKLLENKMVLWNLQALSMLEMEYTYRQSYSKRMFQTYVDILQCYDLCKNCSQTFILFYILEAFIHSLVYEQFAIEAISIGKILDGTNVGVFGSVSMLCWIIKNLIWLTVLSYQCEKFYLALNKIQDSCARLLKADVSDDEKKVCKNILRLHRASFNKIRVCGLFYVDAALHLSLLILFSDYTVVLIAFALL